MTIPPEKMALQVEGSWSRAHPTVALVGPHPSPSHPERVLRGTNTARRLVNWMGLDSDDCPAYLNLFSRANLLSDPCPRAQFLAPARQALMDNQDWLERHNWVVFLGSDIRAAVCEGVPTPDWYVWWPMRTDVPFSARVCFMPHPSGLNRHWNDAEAVEEAREFLSDLLVKAMRGE